MNEPSSSLGRGFRYGKDSSFINNDIKYPKDDYKRHKRKRSRSASKSPDSKKPMYQAGGKTTGDYEARIHALSTQLAMANSQILTLETALETLRNAKSQSENRLCLYQQENGALQCKNNEIIRVMQTLETAVEALQKDKLDACAENSELKKQSEGQHQNVGLLEQQIEALNDRNTTLSKKCVNLLESSKAVKEKLAENESELERLRPHAEHLQKQLTELSQQHQEVVKRATNYEAREQNWIKAKSDLEKRVKELTERAEIAEKQLQQRPLPFPMISAAQSRVNNDRKEEIVYTEQLSKIQIIVESIRELHKTELSRTKEKLKVIEKLSQRAAVPSDRPPAHGSSLSCSPDNTRLEENEKTNGLPSNGRSRDQPEILEVD